MEPYLKTEFIWNLFPGGFDMQTKPIYYILYMTVTELHLTRFFILILIKIGSS